MLVRSQLSWGVRWQHNPTMRTVTSDSSDPIVIRHYRTQFEAEWARVVLEVAGIPCVLLSASYSEVQEPVRLAVRRDYYAAAEAVLSDEESPDGKDGVEPPAI